MTTIQWHDAQVAIDSLDSRLRAVVAEHANRIDSDRVLALLQKSLGGPPRLVLTGQYSSGKSTVIKALTDGRADVLIDADIATDSVTDYDWDGVVILTDTPGVQAGLPLHDRLARDAIARADLVLFVLTVELFDEEAAIHLRDVARDFGKATQTLILINKAGSMRGDVEMRRQAVAEAWGDALPLPQVLQCDADDYLKSLTHPDAERARQYGESSGIQALRAAIDEFAHERGDLARLQQPLQAIRTATTEAQAALADDPEEAAALALMARQRRALTTRRQRIETQLEVHQVRFLTRCLDASETFAGTVESVDDESDDRAREATITHAQEALVSDLDAAAEAFGSAISSEVALQMQDLASEVREIEASPHARVILNLPVDGPPGVSTPIDLGIGRVKDARPGATRGTSSSGRAWMDEVMGALNWFNDSWGAGGGVKTSAGSLGHQVVKDVGHLFGKKFQPWQAVRVANYIGKAARVASVAIPILVAGASIAQEEIAARRAENRRHVRRQRLISEVQSQARIISDDALSAARAQLDPPFVSAYARIDEATRAILESQAARSTATVELSAIRSEAAVALDRLSSFGKNSKTSAG